MIKHLLLNEILSFFLKILWLFTLIQNIRGFLELVILVTWKTIKAGSKEPCVMCTEKNIIESKRNQIKTCTHKT